MASPNMNGKTSPVTPPPRVQLIPLDDIVRDPRLQMRVQMNSDVIADYAEILGMLPPAKVVLDDDGHLFLYDGWHTFHAHILAEKKDMRCEVIKGTFEDALRLAAGANHTHGMRPTNADKRKAVETLLDEEEFAQMSDGALAEICHVTQPFVGKIRKEKGQKQGENDSGHNGYDLNENQNDRIGRDGKIYSMASPQQQQLFCRNCRLYGAKEGCKDCKRFREEKAKPAPEPEKPKARPKVQEMVPKRSQVSDGHGRSVPPRRQKAWNDPWWQSMLDTFDRFICDARQRMDRLPTDWPCPPELAKQIRDFTDEAHKLMRKIDDARSYGVCPQCEGKGCKVCNHKGLLVKTEYEKAALDVTF